MPTRRFESLVSGHSTVAIAPYIGTPTSDNRRFAALVPPLIDRPSRILIVDDEAHNRRVLEGMLVTEGYEVLCAENGERALAMVAHQPPDLILLDVLMDEMDGYEVAARIKGDPANKNIPVIMVTALDNCVDARLTGLTAGAEEVLAKPVDRAELRVRVRNLLRIKSYGDLHDRYSAMLEREIAVRTHDLAERTNALEVTATALRASEERTHFALGAARMGVWEVDVATGTVKWSDTPASVFDLSPDEAPADIAEFRASRIHWDDRDMVEGALARAAWDGTTFAEEFRVLLPGGDTRWVAATACPSPSANGHGVRWLGVGVDITDRRSLEAQLRQAQKMDAVGQLAGGVAHDFNNILTAMLGFSELVLRTFDPEDPRRNDMGEIINAGRRAAMLTRQLLTFSRKQVVQPTAVDLNAVVEGMRSMLSRLMGGQLVFVTHLDPNICAVRADPGQLEQVLMNLVVNARDAMPAGGRISVVTQNVRLDEMFLTDGEIPAGAYVLLAVSDNGIGMDVATKQRVFEPFFTTKAPGKGTGLGLPTVSGIVKESGGYISVFTEPGKGSTFKVFLPCAELTDLAVPRISGEQLLTTEPFGTLHAPAGNALG